MIVHLIFIFHNFPRYVNAIHAKINRKCISRSVTSSPAIPRDIIKKKSFMLCITTYPLPPL